ncbi:protein Shroom isoform X5 [Drosophila tropicalis]|uniref:protein Shroom isoform X5 n=1 Tax=Drosophila tropicalis TaxID=46794 RepID=UPI0035ABF24E
MSQWFQWLGFRSNSKASYLPRQSLEKLNNTDPDHGIYKLTLTPNEDIVAHHHHHHHHHTKPSYGVSGGKLTNNLPDVLPLGVKLQTQTKPPLLVQQQQPSSPNGGENLGVPLRYGSNNNLATNTHSPTSVTSPYTMIYGQATTGTGLGQRYSSPALGQGYGKTTTTTTTPYLRSQSYDMMNKQQQAQHSMVTQSHSDLKQVAHDLETTLEEVIMLPPPPTTPTPTPTPPRLSPASSQSDCSSLELSSNAGEGSHIFRAEVISTTLSHPQTKPPSMNRQESLRENIEKITQLQSQLMSAHICETGILLGHAKLASPSSNKPAPPPPPPQPVASSPISPTTPPPPPPPHTCPPAHEETDEVVEMGLQLMQRSEIVLMVNPKPITMDMACQTDDLFDREALDLLVEQQEQQTRTTLQPRQRQPIELDYELLSRELLKLLKPSDKLVEILTPKSCKPTHEYVSNLYNPDVPLRQAKRDVGTSTLMRMKSDSSDASTPEISGKMINIVELHLTDPSGEGTNLIKQKMDELLRRLNQKIGSLKREQQTIGEESSMNDKLGQELFAQLAEKVRPSEASKFRTYIDDVGHITSLLLSLSERLGQTESSLESRPQDKSILESKRERLYEQLEEAQRLKSDIDRRGTTIASLLGKHLTADMCADYDYFINMKAKLIADARDLAERIKGSEEQLATLNDALVQSDC